MVNVRVFGLLRLTIDENNFHIEADTIEMLLQEIARQYEGISLAQLKNTVIFVNGTDMNQLDRYKTRLQDGDEIMFLSPASGG